MGGKTSTQTSSNVQAPWEEQKPYITKGFGEAEKIYNSSGPQYFPGSTVAGFSPEQQQAFGMTTNRATNGNQTMKAAEGFTQDTLAGKYSGDPYQSQVFQNINSQVTPQVNAQFTKASRYGSGAHTDSLTRALVNSYAPYASQQYQQSLDRMGNAASMAPTFAANDYQDIGALADVGQQRQVMGQAELDDAIARYEFEQNKPAAKLAQFQSGIGGNWGGTNTIASPIYKPSPFTQAAGGAMTLAGLFG